MSARKLEAVRARQKATVFPPTTRFSRENGFLRYRKSTASPTGSEFEIPEGARAARLFVGEDRSGSYQVGLGYLDPIDEVSGYQQRLSNLCYYTGEIDGIDGPLTKSAVRSFQDYENFLAGTEILQVDGIMGPKTKARLELRHGY